MCLIGEKLPPTTPRSEDKTIVPFHDEIISDSKEILPKITTTQSPEVDLESKLFETTAKPDILEDSLFEISTLSSTSTTKSTTKPKDFTSEMAPKIEETTIKIPTETTTKEAVIGFGEY